MTDTELAEKLNQTIANATLNRESTKAYVLFGIKYESELRGRTSSVVRIVRSRWPETGVYGSATNEINHGMRVANCVEITNPPVWLA